MQNKVLVALTVAMMSLVLALPIFATETIKLGALYNLTGGMSSIEASALNGAKFKAKLINESGGILGGKKLEVIEIGTDTDQKAAAKKVLSEGVIAGLGYGDTTFVLAVAPLFQAKGVPFVTSGATHPSLHKQIGDCIFMVSFGNDDQSFAIADFTIKKLEAKNIAVWTDNSMDFTKALSKFYKQRIEELGGRIVLEDFFVTGDKDFSAQIDRLKNASTEPDVVFVSAVPKEAALTVKQIREAGLTLPILSGNGFDTDLVINLPDPKLANEVYFSTHTYRGDPRPEVLDFIKAYEKEYGRFPKNAFAALGFDAVGLIADAITRAGSTDKEALCKALAATKGYKAVTGEITYSRASGVPMKAVAIIGIKNGKYEVLETWFPKE
jgi:branched-chain amino acid transport system substrate-binding protein